MLVLISWKNFNSSVLIKEQQKQLYIVWKHKINNPALAA